MSALLHRLNRLDGGISRDRRRVPKLTDAELEAEIESELAHYDSAAADQYAAAAPGSDERYHIFCEAMTEGGAP